FHFHRQSSIPSKIYRLIFQKEHITHRKSCISTVWGTIAVRRIHHLYLSKWQVQSSTQVKFDDLIIRYSLFPDPICRFHNGCHRGTTLLLDTEHVGHMILMAMA